MRHRVCSGSGNGHRVHTLGLVGLLTFVVRTRTQLPTRFWPITWLLLRVTWWMLLIHAAEMSVWALFYLWKRCLPDAETTFYFSGVTCDTIVETRYPFISPTLFPFTLLFHLGRGAGLRTQLPLLKGCFPCVDQGQYSAR